jgi:hypothetical protein
MRVKKLIVVKKGGHIPVIMYLPVDAWKVKTTADLMYSIKGVPNHQ